MLFFVYIIGIYLALYASYFFIVFFHELGHAVAFIRLTETKKVDIFIGSYGDENTKMKLRIGRMNFFFKFTVPFIKGGMCRSSFAGSNFKKYVLIFFAGPFSALLIVGIITAIVFNNEFHGSIKLFCFALIFLAGVSFFQSLYPGKIRGTNIDTDGAQIALAFKLRKVFTEYVTFLADIEKERIEEATEKLRQIIAVVPYRADLHRLFVLALLQLKKYDEAEVYLKKLEDYDSLTLNEYINYGYLHSRNKRHDEAIANYTRALELDDESLYGLNNLGYELLLKKQYDESAELLEKAIKIDSNFSYAYNTLGLLKLSTDDIETAKILIDRSITLNAENGSAFKHLGMYYLRQKNKQLALLNFDKAIELDNTVDLEQYRDEAEAL